MAQRRFVTVRQQSLPNNVGPRPKICNWIGTNRTCLLVLFVVSANFVRPNPNLLPTGFRCWFAGTIRLVFLHRSCQQARSVGSVAVGTRLERSHLPRLVSKFMPVDMGLPVQSMHATLLRRLLRSAADCWSTVVARWTVDTRHFGCGRGPLESVSARGVAGHVRCRPHLV